MILIAKLLRFLFFTFLVKQLYFHCTSLHAATTFCNGIKLRWSHTKCQKNISSLFRYAIISSLSCTYDSVLRCLITICLRFCFLFEMRVITMTLNRLKSLTNKINHPPKHNYFIYRCVIHGKRIIYYTRTMTLYSERDKLKNVLTGKVLTQ